MPKTHYTLLEPTTDDPQEVLQFRCDQPECKRQPPLTSGDLFDHSKDVHRNEWIQTDTSALKRFGFDREWPAISVYGEKREDMYGRSVDAE